MDVARELMIDERSLVRYPKKIGEPTELPARAPARSSPYWASTVLRRKTLAEVDITACVAFDS